jgi:predicted GNAT family N-acyltransferase
MLRNPSEMGVVRVLFKHFLTHVLKFVTVHGEMDAITVLSIVSRCFSATSLAVAGPTIRKSLKSAAQALPIETFPPSSRNPPTPSQSSAAQPKPKSNNATKYGPPHLSSLLTPPQLRSLLRRTRLLPRPRNRRVPNPLHPIPDRRLDPASQHLLALQDDTPMGTVRLVCPPASEKFKLGRLAVRKVGRGKGVAGMLVLGLEDVARELGAKEIYAGAQVPVRGLYEKCGYRVVDEEEYLDEGQPHIMMSKELV